MSSTGIGRDSIINKVFYKLIGDGGSYVTMKFHYNHNPNSVRPRLSVLTSNPTYGVPPAGFELWDDKCEQLRQKLLAGKMPKGIPSF